jgi:hypothetical protein
MSRYLPRIFEIRGLSHIKIHITINLEVYKIFIQ